MGNRRFDARPYSSSSDDEDVPESVSLSSSKTAALSALRAAHQAQTAQVAAQRERRRAQDALLKEQAVERKKRIQDALDELRQKKKRDETQAERQRRQTISVAPTKRLSSDPAAKGPKAREEEDEEVQVGTAKVVVLKSKRVAKLNARAARELVQKREEMHRLRDRSSTRVHSAALLAHSRVGRPAHRFVLSQAEAEELRVKLKRKPPPTQRTSGKARNRDHQTRI